jgi:hypothetical protein
MSSLLLARVHKLVGLLFVSCVVQLWRAGLIFLACAPGKWADAGNGNTCQGTPPKDKEET